MATTENKTIVRRVIEEVWSQGNLSLIPETVSSSFTYRTSVYPDYHGPEGFTQFVREHREAFPDLHYTLDDMVAEGDRVAVHWTAEGTNTGPMGGMPPTGKHARGSGITIFRITDGLLQEGITVWDALGMLQQLGLIPQPEQAAV